MIPRKLIPASDLAALLSPSPVYVLRAMTKHGQPFYYTGKAGEDWVSSGPDDAFPFQTLEGARRKAENFNKMTGLHGLHFIVMGVHP